MLETSDARSSRPPRRISSSRSDDTPSAVRGNYGPAHARELRTGPLIAMMVQYRRDLSHGFGDIGLTVKRTVSYSSKARASR